jgi:transposase
LARWLETEPHKSRKLRRNLRQVFSDLVALGYRGSYDRVAAFAREWRRRKREAELAAGGGTFVPLVFAPGEAFQFDWSEDWAIVGGERLKLKVAHFKLAHSRAFTLRAYRQETHEMLFDAHNHALRVLGEVPARDLYDNRKTAVDRIGRGKARKVNARSLRW